MYLRPIHADASISTLRQLIRANPLGLLTTAIRAESSPLIQSTHIPFLLDVQDEGSETELGVLRAHLARQNPHSKTMIEAILKQADPQSCVLMDDVQVMFTSTAQHYVTPKFYVDTKPSTGKVVPTWNYAAAQVVGRVKIFWDHKSDESKAFLRKQIDDLSEFAERQVMGFTGVEGQPNAWRVSDAPDRYVELISQNIVGIEIQITSLVGKFKMSQEMPKGDRDGVIQGFEKLGTDVGIQISNLVKERGDLKDSKAK